MKFFRRSGILFIPITLVGWIVFAFALVMAVYEFIDIDRDSHSVSDTLINFAFNVVIIAIIYSVVAFVMNLLRKETEDQ